MKLILDTPPAVQKIYRDMLMKLSGIERMRMGASLSSMMRSFAVSGVTAEGHTGGKLQAEIFMRIYGQDMDPIQRKKIYDYLVRPAS